MYQLSYLVVTGTIKVRTRDFMINETKYKL